MVAALVAAAPFVGAAAGRVLGWIQTYIEKQLKYQRTDVEEKLVKLEESLKKVLALVTAAEKLEIKERNLVDWLSDVTNAIYDAEFLIGVFEYQRLKKEVERWPNKRKKVSAKIQDSASKFFKKLFFAEEELNKLEKLVDKFDYLVKEMITFIKILKCNKTKAQRKRQPTSRRSIEREIFGREKQKEDLLKLLQQSQTDAEVSFSVVSVVGIGGVGKTTLAQFVFSHQSLDDQFDIRAWVHVSNNVEPQQLMISILQNLGLKTPVSDSNNVITLERIHNALVEGLKLKKFLIVLDDVWEDMKAKWESICIPSRYGKEGSKVLVTSRSCNIAKHMGAQEKSQIYLSPLESKDYWEYFKKYSFENRNAEEIDQYLIKTGEEIANKLGGLPLAAKLVGKDLSNLKLDRDWIDVLDTRAWKENKELMSSLKWSYDDLDEHLKKCFLYLSLFPKGYKYNSRTLAHIWVTFNCVKETDGDRRFADIQRKYAPDLVNRCLLMNDSSGERLDEDCYMIHDLLHDLAESIAGNVVYRVEDDKSLPKEAQRNVHHLCVKSTERLDSILKHIAPSPTQLRSLVYFANEGETVEKWKSGTSPDTTKMLKGLCLLVLNFDKLKLQDKFQIWENLGDLQHLRCINHNPGDNKFIVPASFGKLHQLEILQWQHDVTNCNDLHKLISLRYVDRRIITSSLGYLKSLELVPGGKFIVDDQKEGNDIGQLGGLDQIGGDLTLELRMKLSGIEATKAKLDCKQHLNQLNIIEGEKGTIDAEALEALRPHKRLQTLVITSCRSIEKTPNWLSKLENLTKLALVNLPKLQGLHGCHLLNIKELYLDSLPLVKQIIDVTAAAPGAKLFPSLVYVKMSNMKNLEGWCDSELLQVPSSINTLIIKDCNKLTLPPATLQYVLRSIQKVHIENCKELQKSLCHAQQHPNGSVNGVLSSTHASD